ncbi:MAG TPA: hypothetical protein VFO76_06330, partial [Candidatus Kapabacteria bacterium]|nr:hypothetical protein [Candidatus Kapabacteria bacterium]
MSYNNLFAQTAKYTVKTNLVTAPWQQLENATMVPVDWTTDVGSITFTLFPVENQHFDFFGRSYLLAGQNTTWATKDGFMIVTSLNDVNVISPYF